MKRTLILFTALVFIGSLCYAQNDTVKTVSNSLEIKETKVIQSDSISNKIQSDTANYALLYVYRPRNFTGTIISYDLKITNDLLKDNIVGRVKNNSKFIVKLYQEGYTELFAKTESKRKVTLNVKFGKKYYLKCGITVGIMVGRPELTLIYPEQGELDFMNIE